MTERYHNGDTIPITVTVLNSARAKATGHTDVLLTIRRDSDDYYLDFDDDTFKASGWTTRQKVMGEKDSTNSPGVYFYDWDTTDHSGDNYHMEVSSATAANGPWADWAYVVGWLNPLETIFEGSETIQSFLRLARAVLYGNRSGFHAGHGGTGEFKSSDGTKTRVTSPHDSSGNTNGNITTDDT
jgi:hypothetical protein